MSKNKGFSRVLALLLLVCMVAGFAPAAYADADAAQQTKEGVSAEKAVVTDGISEGTQIETQATVRQRTAYIGAPECNNPGCDAVVTVTQSGSVIATLTKDSDPFKVTITASTPVTLTAKPGADCGCEFVNWTKDNAAAGKNATLTIAYRDLSVTTATITAHFKSSKYVVTYSDGVDGRAFASQSYTVNAGAATPAFEGTPTRDGYEFIGWNPEVAETVTENVTYVAQWKNVSGKLVVTYTDGMGGKAFADQAYDVDPGDATPAFSGTPSRDGGFTFLGWSPEVAATVTESVTYTAQWDVPTSNKPRNILAATVDQMEIRAYAEGTKVLPASGGSDCSCSPQIGAKGVNYTIGNVEGNDVDGYTTTVTFHFISGDAFEAAARKVFNTTKNFTDISGWENWIGNWVYSDTYPMDQTLTLHWGTYNGKNTWVVKDGVNITAAIANDIKVGFKLERTVTYTDGVDGEEVFADQVYTVANGSAAPAFNGTPTRAGYKFAGWDPAYDANAKIYADTTYTATWENLFTVTYTDGVDGEEVFADEVYTDLESGTATPAFSGSTERPGWDFKGWKPAVAETVTADATYTAQWTANTYTVSRDSNGGEALDDVNVTFDKPYGDAVVASPRDGYTEDGWFITVDKVVTDIEITADTLVQTAGNHGIFLKRSIAPVTVTVSEDVTKDYDGKEVVLTAAMEEYAGLVYTYQWYKDGEPIEGETGKTLTIVGNVADSGNYTIRVFVNNDKDSGVITENEVVFASASAVVTINKIDNHLTYNSNGGDDADSTVDTKDSSIAVDAAKEGTRKGYTFVGWNTKADGTGDSYKAGDEFAFDDNGNGGVSATLYAQWEANEYTLKFQIGKDPELKEEIKLSFTSKPVIYGEKVGEFPWAKREGYVLVWYDENNNIVNSDTVYLVDGDSTYTAWWVKYTPPVQTGDSSNVALYAAAMFASIACIGAGILLLRRKRED